ncbi:MAG TPA: OB-fold nucleic acid binding domain-containing protein, partial [bacterium]|nr:OB-fold nucleic acid binding domain-containing protein [bacterium]
CNLLRRLRCRDFECLIASLSLIRPGASNQNKVEHYARRHSGLDPSQYIHPSVQAAMKDTYGLMVYEEHILMVAHLFAGMDLGRADLLRRALVKQSDREKAAGFEVEFRELAIRKGRNQEEIDQVWKFLLDFCGYSFNKAHSSSYAVLAYQAAYLKSHFPAEFMASVLSSGKGFYSRLTYVLESLHLGIAVDGPNVNSSQEDYFARNGRICVPLSQIKDLTQKTIRRTLKARRPFSDLADFLLKVEPSPSELDSLIRSGACDTFGENRPALLWMARTSGIAGTPSLKGESADEGNLLTCIENRQYHSPERPKYSAVSCPIPDYTLAKKIRDEMDLLGFPLSGHPLDAIDPSGVQSDCQTSRDLEKAKTAVSLCGIIVAERSHKTQGGSWMKFATLSDRTGMIEVVLFPEVSRKYAPLIGLGKIVLISGTIQRFEHKRVGSLIAEVVRNLGEFEL